MLVVALSKNKRISGNYIMSTALKVAEQIIRLAKNEDGLVNELTPLKLQKLLFYSQAWYAANNDTRLFEDDIMAYPLGPVVEEVLQEYKKYGATDLKQQVKEDITEDKSMTDDLRSVLKVYGNMSAYELVARTHKEEVWRKNYDASNKLIPFDEIRKAFKLKLATES